MDKDTLKKNTDENLDKEVPKSLTFVQHPSVIKSNPSHQPIPNEKTEDRFKQKNSSHHLAEWYNNMQSAFEADMLELRATLQMEFQTTLQTERQGYEAKVAELNETLEKAQHQIFKFKRQMEWKKGSMCALSDQMVKFNVFKLKNFVYFIWKQKWRGLKHLESKYHWAILYHQKWVQRKVVWALRNAVVLPWQQSFEKRVRNEAEACIAATSQKYETKFEELTSQLIQVEKVRKEEEIRMKNKEEETKKAFLRGLSILNIETMSILKQQSEEPHDLPSIPYHADMQHPSSSLYMKDIESMYHASTKGLPIPFHAEVPMTHHPIHSILEDDHSNSLMNSSLYQEIQTASPLPPPLPSPTPYSSSLQKRTQVTSPTRKKEPVSQSKPPVHASKRGVSRSVYVTRHPPPSLVG